MTCMHLRMGFTGLASPRCPSLHDMRQARPPCCPRQYSIPRVISPTALPGSGQEGGSERPQTCGGPAGQLASLALALLSIAAPLDCQAYSNVRVEDVESPSLQAGLMAANEGRYDEAERFFTIYLKEEPTSASGWSNLGNVHLSQGKARQAESDYGKAIELAPEAAVPYLNRAVAREQLGVDQMEAGSGATATELWEAALADCTAAVEHDPQEFAAWFDRGNIQMRLGRYASALEDFRTAANLAPGLAGYRLREATLLFQQGEPQSAQTMIRGLVRKYPQYAEAHAALAAVSWEDGKQAAAEESFEKATRSDPRWGSMDFIRGNTRWPPRLYQAMERFLSLESSS